jgi:two-component system, cell cycle sensor histidine kinase and response regulator CckA
MAAAPGGAFLEANPALVAMLGCADRGELLGKAVSDFWHSPDAGNGYGPLVLENAPGKSHELQLVRKNGTAFTARASVREVTDEGGNALFLDGILEDVTDQKQSEEAIRRANNMESLGLLAGGIAHDFNNILTGVTGNLSLLLRLAEEGSEIHSLAADAKAAADRTRALASQLMTFSRGGAPSVETVRVDALIRETTRLSLSGSKSKAEYDLAADLMPVCADPGQIGQVIQNLVLNANQAMPGGGGLKVSARNVEVRSGGGPPVPPGMYVKVSVEDEGVGISPNQLNRIFDPYYSTKASGHGLGLSIVHSIIARHGGCVEAHSEVDRGARFSFYLPAASLEPGPADEPQEKAGGGYRPHPPGGRRGSRKENRGPDAGGGRIRGGHGLRRG